MSKIENAGLECSRCGTETAHDVAYAGRLLVKVTCTRCGKTIERDLRAEYLADLGRRVVTKPKRMFKRFCRNPLGYAGSLPKTVPAKPMELLSDVRLVWDAARTAPHGVRGRQPGRR
ncbi:hypothetical protein [Amycolatopsis alkalitolerans]|uniref:Bh protein n=1 Tax=Amycolatopsis alkalitolerans TaxID=2547244 RepID=A0A5C4M7N9_9PSEU|nr:hypothetical protein [Amycolatopsis alkalitolerans]TNC29478.1 hypothetical protein FG385_00410 [Amycolatopsis alkalitolerans]